MGLVLSVFKYATSALSAPTYHQAALDKLTSLRRRSASTIEICDFQEIMVEITEYERMILRRITQDLPLKSADEYKAFALNRCSYKQECFSRLINAKEALYTAFENKPEFQDVKSSVDDYMTHLFIQNYFIIISALHCSENLNDMLANDISLDALHTELPTMKRQFDGFLRLDTNDEDKQILKSFKDFLEVQFKDQLTKPHVLRA